MLEQLVLDSNLTDGKTVFVTYGPHILHLYYIMPRTRFPIPGDERVKIFVPYIYHGDGNYFYIVTPLGSIRLTYQEFQSYALKCFLSVTFGVIAGYLMWRYLN